jgi:hypothetical protein
MCTIHEYMVFILEMLETFSISKVFYSSIYEFSLHYSRHLRNIKNLLECKSECYTKNIEN